MNCSAGTLRITLDGAGFLSQALSRNQYILLDESHPKTK